MAVKFAFVVPAIGGVVGFLLGKSMSKKGGKAVPIISGLAGAVGMTYWAMAESSSGGGPLTSALKAIIPAGTPTTVPLSTGPAPVPRRN
jgi:hypothetical protein